MKKIVKDCQLCKIRSSAIFNSISEQQVEKLNKCITTHEYKCGELIFYKGNPSLAIFCIHSGKVKLFKTGYSGEEFEIRLLGPGEIFGFRDLLADEHFAATAQAVSDARFISYPKRSLLIIMIVNIFSISIFFDVNH